MESYAYVLLALIDNLEIVRFEYTTEEGEECCTINIDDALVAAGKDIKNCAKSVSDLLILMRKFDLEEPSLTTYEK